MEREQTTIRLPAELKEQLQQEAVETKKISAKELLKNAPDGYVPDSVPVVQLKDSNSHIDIESLIEKNSQGVEANSVYICVEVSP